MPWFDTYRAYDDDTLTTLANAGLLRRAAKDVEAGKVHWAEQRDDGGIIEADGQRVALDARGPQHARCDCPAPGICKHILGAVLWLRAFEAVPADAAAPSQAQDTTSVAAQAVPSALDEVLALDAAALFKAAGAAAVRRAAATPVEQLVWHDQGAVLVLELPELGASCRWIAGAGFAGMVSEVPAAERRAVHLIALAALRRERGCPFEWPGGVQRVPVEDDGAATERERQFLDQVTAMLRELLDGGLAHVSDVTSARLFALNMSARGEGLPRLAALLRNLGGMADLLVRRDHRVEARDALALMARIHALCAALAGARGEQATKLRGRLRRDFDETQALDLLPIGAHWWQTRGGARGLTMAFWDAADARVLQAALARPDGSDTSFTRHSAWATQAFWHGAGTAQHMCTSALRLEQPRLAEDGRLALGGVTRAQTQPAWRADDARVASIGCGDWAQLAEDLRAAVGLCGNAFDVALLRAQATDKPRLDEVRQCVDWPVMDAQGRWIVLTLPCGPEYERRVANLDGLAERRADIRAILVRIDRASAATLLMPLAVLEARADGMLCATSLDFADEPKRTSSLVNRILRMLESKREAPPALASSTLATRLLAPALEVIETQAETGRMSLTDTQSQTLRQVLANVEAIGLDSIAHALREHLHEPSAASLLRVTWLCQLVSEIDGLPV